MAHSFDVKERALQLWVQGLSLDDIRLKLKEGGVVVNKKTLVRWKKINGWDARKAAIIGEVQEKNDGAAVESLQELATELSKLRKRVVRELSTVTFRTAEGAVTAYVQILDRITKLMPAEAAGGDAGEVIKKVLDVLFKHPKVGVVLEKYREDILNELNKALNQPDAHGHGQARGPAPTRANTDK